MGALSYTSIILDHHLNCIILEISYLMIVCKDLHGKILTLERLLVGGATVAGFHVLITRAHD
jgi:hypothetical protein